APRGARRARPDIVAGAEASSLGAQDDDARARVTVGFVKALDEQAPELGRDGVELLRPVERHDADAAVDGVGHERGRHRAFLLVESRPRGFGRRETSSATTTGLSRRYRGGASVATILAVPGVPPKGTSRPAARRTVRAVAR